MGSVSLKIGDGTARFKRGNLCSSALNALMLFSLVTTNLFALYAFTSHHPPASTTSNHLVDNNISHHVSLILKQIDSSQNRLSLIQKELLGYQNIDPSAPNLPYELKLFLRHHPLPLGKDSRSGITHMVASVGHSCHNSIPLLSKYMNYNPAAPCPPAHSILAHKLILAACHPLPRTRCLTNNKKNKPPSSHHHDYDLLYQKFLNPKTNYNFPLDHVLALAPPPPAAAGIRIGLDIGSSSGGAFAAVMARRNVTIVTSTLNATDFITARGLFPLSFTLDQRFPFYDNVFDLVHTLNHLGDTDAAADQYKLEFFMFDIDRVLRPGGLFWLDDFHCLDHKTKTTLTRLIERFGYKKLKWVAGEKLGASGTSQLYLSAVLQKPVRVQ